ncbi:hypothetical protein [Streptomyces sp. NPDC006012]|uniref:hypothetical protein n=1 Tax=Streptomyces sp. NPDC006012 TaxID=3364739 RepID=UPI00368570BB
MESDLSHRDPLAAAAGRPRDTVVIPEAIRRSAMKAGTSLGYYDADGRAIARQADVSAMTAHRSSGSEKKLFTEVVDASAP